MVSGCTKGKNIPKPAFAGKQIQELGIGTFRNIATVQQTATLYEALSIFVERRVSALPVVDEHGMSLTTTLSLHNGAVLITLMVWIDLSIYLKNIKINNKIDNNFFF